MRRRVSKYRAVPTVVDGIRFASKKEARRYQELRLLEKAGEISSLRLQPAFPCKVAGVVVCTYRGDFAYDEPCPDKAEYPGEQVMREIVEDAKGFRTPVYRLKKKLVEALYGIQIREV